MPSPIRSVQLLTVYVNLRLNGSHVLMIANDCACVYVCPRKNLRIQIWKFLVLPVCFFGLETTLDIRLPPPPPRPVFLYVSPTIACFVFSYLLYVYRLCLETSFSRRNTPQVYRQGPKKKKNEKNRNKTAKKFTNKENKIQHPTIVVNQITAKTKQAKKKLEFISISIYWNILCSKHIFFVSYSPTSRMVSIRETWPFLFFPNFFFFYLC